jgi:hypothetical protein
MTKRVYEIARELNLTSKDVLDRLHDAGVKTKSNLAGVDEPVYQRVFGNGSDSPVQDDRPAAQDLEGALGGLERRRERSRVNRVLVYVLIAIVGFVLSIGIGMLASIVVGSQPSPTASKKPQLSDGQRHLQRDTKKSSPEQSETEYVDEIGKLQNESVSAFLNSHNKILHYDALDAGDIEEMHANENSLKQISDRVDKLTPPGKYVDQYEAFSAAVHELQKATRLAYALAADPITATQAGFEEYDRHADSAATLLERSNKALDREYETIEGVQIRPS